MMMMMMMGFINLCTILLQLTNVKLTCPGPMAPHQMELLLATRWCHSPESSHLHRTMALTQWSASTRMKTPQENPKDPKVDIKTNPFHSNWRLFSALKSQFVRCFCFPVKIAMKVAPLCPSRLAELNAPDTASAIMASARALLVMLMRDSTATSSPGTAWSLLFLCLSST